MSNRQWQILLLDSDIESKIEYGFSFKFLCFLHGGSFVCYEKSEKKKLAASVLGTLEIKGMVFLSV